MDHAQYLRDRATEFARLARTTDDAMAAQNFQELAILCRESAERLARRADPVRVLDGALSFK
ncbi:MAG TPA: hypothetical protein VE397_11220 [Stellaceae bacterium]|nr:hypothetical protein [Stellaceae bacterium]